VVSCLKFPPGSQRALCSQKLSGQLFSRARNLIYLKKIKEQFSRERGHLLEAAWTERGSMEGEKAAGLPRLRQG